MAKLESYGEKGFLGLAPGDIKAAKAIVLPYAFSQSEAGRKGPEEILKASASLQAFDDELFDDIPSQIPIWTAKQPAIPAKPEEAVSALAELCDGLGRQKKLPVIIGGDHTITSGALQGLSNRYPAVSLVIFDSHLDFTDPGSDRLNKKNWLGRALNLTGVQNAVVLGARSYNKAEWNFWKTNLSKLIVYEAGTEGPWNLDTAMDFLDQYVYVSFDLDVLDPSIMPATDSPEPEGLSFRQALAGLRRILAVRNIIGMDVCNYAPIPNFRSPGLIAAQLVKKMILYSFKGKQLLGK